MFAQFPNGVCTSCPPYPPVVQLGWFPSPCICIVNQTPTEPPTGTVFGATGSQPHQRPEAGRDSVRMR